MGMVWIERQVAPHHPRLDPSPHLVHPGPSCPPPLALLHSTCSLAPLLSTGPSIGGLGWGPDKI